MIYKNLLVGHRLKTKKLKVVAHILTADQSIQYFPSTKFRKVMEQIIIRCSPIIRVSVVLRTV